MADAGWTTKLGATPGKLVVVALLATGLVTVLLFQVSGSSAPADTVGERGNGKETRQPSAPDSLVAPAEPPAAAKREPSSLPEITLEEASEYDPFALVPALAELVITHAPESSRVEADADQLDGRSRQSERTLDALRDKGVQMVLLGQGDPLAIMGDRAVRVGDMMDGLEVIAIDTQGITLSEQADTSQ